jgi:mRNA interferase RelE/StbE
MGSYSVEWKRSAAKELKDLPRDVVLRVLSKVEGLSEDPYPSGVKKLVGAEHTYRVRVGDYRIVYSIWSSKLLIEIVRVGHRKEVYEDRS